MCQHPSTLTPISIKPYDVLYNRNDNDACIDLLGSAPSAVGASGIYAGANAFWIIYKRDALQTIGTIHVNLPHALTVLRGTSVRLRLASSHPDYKVTGRPYMGRDCKITFIGQNALNIVGGISYDINFGSSCDIILPAITPVCEVLIIKI